MGVKLNRAEKAAIAVALVFVVLLVGYLLGMGRLGGGFTVTTEAARETVTPVFPSAVSQAQSPSPSPTPPPTPNFPIDLNAATVEELQALPKIGPALAARIIAYRQEHGNFTSIEELKNVSGIGAAIYADVEGLITVSAGGADEGQAASSTDPAVSPQGG